MEHNRRPSFRRALAALSTAALVAAGTVVGIAAPAQAAADNTLTWGIKESFRSYVTGPIASGSISSIGAVTDTAPFVWSSGTGSIASGLTSGSVSYDGGIHFTGHSGQLDLTLENPTITVTSGTAATLYADVTSKPMGSATATVYADVAFATVTLGTPTSSGSVATWTAAPAVLTAAGAQAFAGFYGAGMPLDPLTFSASVLAPPAPVAQPTTTSLQASPNGTAAALASVTLTATVAPAAAGSVTFSDGATVLGSAAVAGGTATLSTTALAVGTRSLTATFTPSDPAAHTGSSSAATPYVITGTPSVPTPTAPTVTVSKTTGLDAAGETVTVTGTGFVPSAPATDGTRPPLTGKFGGTYVAFGYYVGETWTSAGRGADYTKWAVGADDVATIGGAAAGGIPISADGSFTTTLTAIELASAPQGARFGIRTYAGGGSTYAPFSTFTALTFADDVPPIVTPVTPATPAITLSAGSVVQGDTLTVNGTGFPSGAAVTATVYSDPVVLGTTTTGSSGAFSISGTIPRDLPAGSHTLTVTAGALSVSQVFSVSAAAASAPETAVVATCTARAVAGATISWGVKQSFVSYINGPIANGSASIAWGAGSGAYNADENLGRVNYGGGATFTGHSGLLDLKISNPTIQVTGSRTATLSAYVSSAAYGGNPAVNGRVALATLSLGAATVSGSRISWSGASTTLTAAGASAFGGFYTAGTAMDPVSFAFPLGADVPCDVSTSGELASTGGTTPDGTIWLGLGMLVLGVGLVALRRRKAASVR